MAKLSAAQVVNSLLEEIPGATPSPIGSPDDPWRAKSSFKKPIFKKGDFQGKRTGGLPPTKAVKKVTGQHAARFQWKPEEPTT